MVSSNRAGRARGGPEFGGGGFAHAPHGILLAETAPAEPVRVFELDPRISAAAQREYPCYVAGLTSLPSSSQV